MNKTEIEKLRFSLIQASIDFMKTIDDDSLPTFAIVERNHIEMLCKASPEMIQSLAKAQNS